MKSSLLIATIFSVILCGCASSGSKTYTGPEGVTYKEEKDIRGVWLAEGFNFTGFDTLVVAEPTSNAESRSEEERTVLASAKTTLRQELVNALQGTGMFPQVVISTNEVSPNAQALVLENNIYHHEKGGGGARYFAGLYGAGQPVIKVAGKMRAGDQVLFRYDIDRSGESAGARMVGAFKSDEDIQREDLKDLAKDLASFVERTAKGLPAE